MIRTIKIHCFKNTIQHKNSFENFSYESIVYNKNQDEFYIVDKIFTLGTVIISDWIIKTNFSSESNFLSDESNLITENITIDDTNNIYIISELNLFYKFSKNN